MGQITVPGPINCHLDTKGHVVGYPFSARLWGKILKEEERQKADNLMDATTTVKIYRKLQ